MPFIERPDGFSAETLALLDTAMMKIWLDHAALAQADMMNAVAKAAPDAKLHSDDGHAKTRIANDNSR